MRTLSLFLVAVLAAACQAPPAEETAPERTAAQVEADFDALRADWQSMAVADNAEGVAAMYAEDAVFTDVYGNIYNGRDAILGYLQESFAAATDLVIQTTDMLFSGDMVAGYGTFSQTVPGPEGDMVLNGMWQTVSTYQPDGSIQIHYHQSMLPAEPPEM
jgi:uncharacterized protein (TIGR02246 family)